jgi:mannose-6-phosphate isomerase-like protein (cupin superfamily)
MTFDTCQLLCNFRQALYSLRKAVMPRKDSSSSDTSPQTAIFDIHAIARNLPATATTMIVDTRLVDAVAASARVFRVYTPVPVHYHATCDEYLLVLSGRAQLIIGDAPPFEASPGKLIFFEKATPHGLPVILEEPFVVFVIDTPRRDPSDVIFLNPEAGTPATFIQSTAI